MNNTSRLSFTNEQAIGILSMLSISLFQCDNILFHFVDSDDDASFYKKYYDQRVFYSCGDGNTITGVDNVYGVYVGLSDLVNACKEDTVNDLAFTLTLVAMYHERQHVDQILYGLHCVDKTSQYVALSHFSECMYQKYHDLTHFCQADEIQAEYNGVLKGYKQLLDWTRDQHLSESLICDCVNYKYRNNVSFLSRDDYTCIKDILCDFRQLFKYECENHKKFQFTDAEKSEISILTQMMEEPNGNVQNWIATKRLQVYLNAKGKQTGDWDEYDRFMSLPVVKSFDLNDKKFVNWFQRMFDPYAFGRSLRSKDVSIGSDVLEREILDYADSILKSQDDRDITDG